MKQFGRLAIIVIALSLALSACVGTTAVVFENRTACGTITVELTNTQTNTPETHEVKMTETLSVEVSPNTIYQYVVDFTASGKNDEGMICTQIQRGQVTVPTGASVYFNLTAVTPTPATAP